MTLDLARRVFAFCVLIVIVLYGPVLYAQVAEAVTTAPQVPDASANEWGGTLIWAFFSSTAFEWLKQNAKFTLVTERTTFWAQRAMGVVLAVAAALGVHYTYDPTAGVLMISGLTAAGLWTAATESVRAFVTQEVMYRVAVKKRSALPLQ